MAARDSFTDNKQAIGHRTGTLVEGMEGIDKDKGEMLASVQGNDSTEVTVTKRARTGNESVDEFVRFGDCEKVLAASDGSQQKLMAMCIGLKVDNVLFEVTNKNFSLIPRNKHLIDEVKRQAKLIPGCLHVTTSNRGEDWLLKWLEEHPIVNEIDVLFLCGEEE